MEIIQPTLLRDMHQYVNRIDEHSPNNKFIIIVCLVPDEQGNIRIGYNYKEQYDPSNIHWQSYLEAMCLVNCNVKLSSHLSVACIHHKNVLLCWDNTLIRPENLQNDIGLLGFNKKEIACHPVFNILQHWDRIYVRYVIGTGFVVHR
jgi:hypothetical protein